ncbi:MAG: DUF2630 family protein [Candidatus Limnocylindrales bacterium]
MKDQTIFERINHLAGEEEELWRLAGDGSGLDASERQRLDQIKVELDQAYDLLHQRDARRAVGEDPNEASLRPPEIVERYQQ